MIDLYADSHTVQDARLCTNCTTSMLYDALVRLMALTYCKVPPTRKSEVIEIGLTEQRGDDVPAKLTVICHGGCWGVASMG